MRELLKKLGSLALAGGALSLVLLNAAMTHGCASSPATQATPQAGPPSGGAESPSSNASAVHTDPAADPDCEAPAHAPYMYATKAPVWMPPAKCHGGAPLPKPTEQQAPAPRANSEQDDL